MTRTEAKTKTRTGLHREWMRDRQQEEPRQKDRRQGQRDPGLENETGVHRQTGSSGTTQGSKQRETEARKPQMKTKGVEGGRDR